MALSKLEIQQMLREMNVKFHADESYESLKVRLQQENHSLWLKSVSGNRSAADGTEKIVVRKRKKSINTEGREVDPVSVSAKPTPIDKPANKNPSDRHRKAEPGYRSLPIEKPVPGQPWKSAADGTEPFNRKKNVFDSVLQRAKRCCERCGMESAERTRDVELEPFYILPLSHGGEHSIKNVVALCPSCRQTVENDPSSKEIKELKRKTRSRLYDSLQVVRKKRTRPRRQFSHRGK